MRRRRRAPGPQATPTKAAQNDDDHPPPVNATTPTQQPAIPDSVRRPRRPRRPRRAAALSSPSPPASSVRKSGRRRSAARMFESGQRELRVNGSNSAAKRKDYFDELLVAFEKSSHAVAEEFRTVAGDCGSSGESGAGLREVLAVGVVCDDTLAAGDLGRRLCDAMAALKNIQNFSEVDAAVEDMNVDDEGVSGGGGKASGGDAFPAAGRKELVKDLATSLCVDRFTSHSSNMVRLLTACVLSELLRITAPNPMLPSSKTRSVARLFVEQLLPLGVDPASDPLHSYRFSLLEQLSTVKAFLVFADDTDVALDTFAAVYTLTRPSHSHKLTSLVSGILTTLLEEREDVVPQPLLDAALAPLILGNGYSSEAVRLAEGVVVASQLELQVPLCNFFNAALRSNPSQRNFSASARKGRRRAAKTCSGLDSLESDDDLLPVHGEGESPSREVMIAELSSGKPGKLPESELLADVEGLLIRIHRVAPDILIYVLPNLERDLRSPEVEKRLRCVRLLSSLFTACPSMVRTYGDLLADFIARSKDADSTIRIELCEASARLIIANPSLRESLCERLAERILDKEDKVRLAAIASVAEASSVISGDEVFRKVGDRLRDKKVSVRQAALRSLEVIYQTGYRSVDIPSSPLLGSEDGGEEFVEDDSPSTTIPAQGMSLYNRHHWIPACLLQCMVTMYNVKDYDTGIDIELALFDRMHRPKGPSTSAEDRLLSFCAMLDAFDKPTVVMLKNAAVQRKRVRDSLSEVIRTRLEMKGRRLDRANAATDGESCSDEEGQGEDYAIFFSKRSRKSRASKEILGLEAAASSTASAFGDAATAGKRLAAILPDMRVGSSSARKLALELAEVTDLKVFKCLSDVLDPTCSPKVVAVAAQDAISRVGSKSDLGLFLQRIIILRCRPGLFSSDHVHACLQICIKECSGAADDDANEGETPPKSLRLGAEGSTACDSGSDIERENDAKGSLRDHLGCVRYLDLVYAAMPNAFGRDNAALVTQILTSESIGEAYTAGLGQSVQVFKYMLVTCCLKIVHSLGRPAFDDWADQILDSCGKRALSWSADPEHCSRHAKWALRTFVVLAGNGEGAQRRYCALFAELSERLDAFDGDLELLIAPMSAMTQLAELRPVLFKDFALSSFDFARALLVGTMSSKVRTAVGKVIVEESDGDGSHHEARLKTGRRLSRFSLVSSSHSDPGGSESSEVFIFFQAARTLSEAVRRASKLLVAALNCLESPDEEASTAVATLVSVAVEKNGNVFGFSGIDSIPGLGNAVADDDSILDAMADVGGICRLAAGCAILRIGCNSRLAKKIQPAEYLSIVLCAQDEHPDIRLLFARKVAKRVMKHKLPFRWAASLALLSIDPEKDNVSAVKGLLDDCIRARRRSVNALLQSCTYGTRSVTHLMPEAILPELVWISANHPDAAVDEENCYSESERYLDFFFDGVLGCGEYASVLNQFLNSLSIASDATDVSDGERLTSSQRISDIARIGTGLLQKKRSARKWTLIEHEGKVTLPSDLFAIISRPLASAGAGPNDALSVAKRFDLDSERLTKSAERRGRAVPALLRSSPGSSRKRAPVGDSILKSPRPSRRSKKTPESKRKSAEFEDANASSDGPDAFTKDSDSKSPRRSGRSKIITGSKRKSTDLEKADHESEGVVMNDGESAGAVPAHHPKVSRRSPKKNTEAKDTDGATSDVVSNRLKSDAGGALDVTIEPRLPVIGDEKRPAVNRRSRRKRDAPVVENEEWFESEQVQDSLDKNSGKKPVELSPEGSSSRRSRRQPRRPSRFGD